MPDSPTIQILTLGKISGVFGVKGWVKIYSHTSPLEQIISYSPLYLKNKGGWKPVKILNGQKQGKGVVAHFEGVDDRDKAFSLIGTELGIEHHQLSELPDNSYYWADLEGLQVITVEGIDLGTLSWIFETGSNDIMVVKGDSERFIPWIRDDVIKSVSLEDSRIVVDWDPDF